MIGLRSEPRLAGWHQRHTPNCYAILHGKHVLQIVVWMTRRKEGSGKRGIPECGSPLYLGQPTKVSLFSSLNEDDEPSLASHRLVLSSDDMVQVEVIQDCAAPCAQEVS